MNDIQSHEDICSIIPSITTLLWKWKMGYVNAYSRIQHITSITDCMYGYVACNNQFSKYTWFIPSPNKGEIQYQILWNIKDNTVCKFDLPQSIVLQTGYCVFITMDGTNQQLPAINTSDGSLIPLLNPRLQNGNKYVLLYWTVSSALISFIKNFSIVRQNLSVRWYQNNKYHTDGHASTITEQWTISTLRNMLWYFLVPSVNRNVTRYVMSTTVCFSHLKTTECLVSWPNP